MSDCRSANRKGDSLLTSAYLDAQRLPAGVLESGFRNASCVDPAFCVAGEDDALGDFRPWYGQRMVGRLGAALSTFWERPGVEFNPEFGDWAPVALDPAAVLVGAVAPILPLRARGEELGVAGHVQVALGVLDSPAVGAVVAEEHGVRVDLFKDLQVAGGLDLQEGLGAGAEALDPLVGVGRRQRFGVLPVLEFAAHEGGVDDRGLAALLDDDGVELVGAVDVEDLLPVLEAEDPLPATVVKKEPAQGAGTVIGVEARGHDEAEAAAVSQKSVGVLEKELVGVSLPFTAVLEWVTRVGVTAIRAAARTPASMEFHVCLTAG